MTKGAFGLASKDDSNSIREWSKVKDSWQHQKKLIMDLLLEILSGLLTYCPGNFTAGKQKLSIYIYYLTIFKSEFSFKHF